MVGLIVGCEVWFASVFMRGSADGVLEIKLTVREFEGTNWVVDGRIRCRSSQAIGLISVDNDVENCDGVANEGSMMIFAGGLDASFVRQQSDPIGFEPRLNLHVSYSHKAWN